MVLGLLLWETKKEEEGIVLENCSVASFWFALSFLRGLHGERLGVGRPFATSPAVGGRGRETGNGGGEGVEGDDRAVLLSTLLLETVGAASP